MPSLYDEIIMQRGSLENLVAKIPGFKGYQEKQARRTADRLLRERLTEEMTSLIKRFNRLESKLLDEGGLAHMTRTREVKSKMQAYRDKVETAAPKYSSMWASIKIDEDALDRIYAFDEAQFRFVMKLENALDKFEEAVKSGENIEDELENVYDVAVEANEAFELREDEILQISRSAM